MERTVAANPSWKTRATQPQARWQAQWTLVALICGSVLAAAPAWAFVIQVDSIVSAPGSDFTPNSRLGLTTANVSDTSVTHVVNFSDCKAIMAHASPIVRITWSWTDPPVSLNLTSPRYGIKLEKPGSSCDGTKMTEDNASSGCKVLLLNQSFGSVLTTTAKLLDVNLSDLLGAPDCAVATETQGRIYFIIEDNSTNTPVISNAVLSVGLDTKAPQPPTVTGLTAGGENIKIAWTQVDEATTPYARVYWSKVPFTASAPSTATNKSEKLSGNSYTIAGVTNGTTYYLAVTAIDNNDNESAAGEVREGIPVEVQDFWQYYKASGGASDGGYYGCSTGPGRGAPASSAALGLLLCAGLFLLGRRRVRGLARAGVGTRSSTLWAIVAVTVTATTLMTSRDAAADSPRTTSLDLRFGYFSPQIDSEFATTNGQTPYETIFGDSGLSKGISVDQILFDRFGDLSVGVSMSWWSMTGKARALDGGTAQDATKLNVMPLTLDLVYRFNWVAFRYGFPLIPYAKGGLAYAFWWAYDGNDEQSSYTDPTGKVTDAAGGVIGLHGVVGMRLLLDVFEPKAARAFDIDHGVNHSYLFVEYQRMSLNNFGDSKALDLSDDVLMFGLAFDL
jgi:hypothetical protein